VQESLVRSERAARSCDLLLAVGSTLSVYPIAAVVPLAKQAGAKLVIINREATEFDEIADLVIREDIGTVLAPFIAH